MPGLTAHWAPIWDLKAEECDADGAVGRSTFNPEAWQVLADSAAWMLKLDDSMRLLDVGCGTGRLSYMVRGLVRRYVGIDLSMEQLRRGNGPRARASAMALPLADASVDAVLMSGLVGSLSPEELLAALVEARRVCVPGGRCALTGILMRHVWLLVQHDESHRTGPNHQSLYYPEHVAQLAGEAGWVRANILPIDVRIPQWALYFDVVLS